MNSQWWVEGKLNNSLPRFYAIVDAGRLGLRSASEVTAALLEAGVRLIQYRNKQSPSRELFEVSCQMADRIGSASGILVVNDRADVACASGASGVHLGQDDLPAAMVRHILPSGKLIGVSTHSAAQVKEADEGPADYIAIGPVFATATKERPDPLVGFEGVRAARQMTRKPLVAIGGIRLENVRQVMEHGADSVAVAHDLLSATDIAARAREFLEILA